MRLTASGFGNLVTMPRSMIMSLDIDRIDKPIRTLRKFLKKVPKRPGVEQIHDLRTSSRRFETEVDAFGLSSKPNERRLLPDLRRIRKRAGKIRDLDVLTGHLLGLVVNGEQDCIIVSQGEMPATQYTLMHPSARLTAPERTAICQWAKSTAGSRSETVAEE